MLTKTSKNQSVDSEDDSNGYDTFIPAERNNPDEETFEMALARDPISLARSIIRSIRASGKRREMFDTLIKDGNEKGWYGCIVPLLQLLQDVKTRWDSVFYMIQRLRLLRPVSPSSLNLYIFHTDFIYY